MIKKTLKTKILLYHFLLFLFLLTTFSYFSYSLLSNRLIKEEKAELIHNAQHAVEHINDSIQEGKGTDSGYHRADRRGGIGETRSHYQLSVYHCYCDPVHH